MYIHNMYILLHTNRPYIQSFNQNIINEKLYQILCRCSSCNCILFKSYEKYYTAEFDKVGS